MNNMLIKRCLTHGVVILPYQLDAVLKRYEVNKIPDDVLCNLRSDEIKKYVKALYYSSLEMAADWWKGHKLLMELGFVREEVKVDHRSYIKLVWGGNEA